MIKRPISEQDQWIVDTNNAVTGIAPAGTGKETTLVSATTDAVTGGITYYPVAGGVPRGFPIILAQSAIPMILPSSGTMGANGSLTGLTAMSHYTIFPVPCFMYFPAGKVFSGSPAGLYFAIILTATTATVYNNMYTSGLPQAAIPVVPTPVVDAGPGAYAQATTEITLASITVPGGMMGANGSLRLTRTESVNNNANAKSPKAYFGGSAFGFASMSITSASGAKICRDITNRGVASQIALAASSVTSYAAGNPLPLAINTQADVALALTSTKAVDTDYMIIESFCVEVLPG